MFVTYANLEKDCTAGFCICNNCNYSQGLRLDYILCTFDFVRIKYRDMFRFLYIPHYAHLFYRHPIWKNLRNVLKFHKNPSMWTVPKLL